MCESGDGRHIDDGYRFDFYGNLLPQPAGEVTRRNVVGAALGSAVLYIPARTVVGADPATWLAERTADATAIGAPADLVAQKHAMHLHASHCEGVASMASHVREASAAAVDFLHYTPHDDRASAKPSRYRDRVTLEAAKEPTIAGREWQWVLSPIPKGCLVRFDKRTGAARNALHLAASTSGAAEVTAGVKANTKSRGNHEHRGNIGGRTFQPDIYLGQATGEAWLELRLALSIQANGVARVLKYRFGPTPKSPERPNANEVVIYRTVGVGKAARPLVVPADDVAAYWPDIVALDNSVTEVFLQAVARKGGAIDGYFSGMTMTRSVTGQAALDAARQTLAEVVARASTTVIARLGMEFSSAWHINGYAGVPGLAMPLLEKAGGGRPTTVDYVKHVHAQGGFAVYNHPFGVEDPESGTDSVDAQRQRVRAKAQDLIAGRVYGADGIELGYYMRGRVDLANHLYLGELLVGNGIFATWTGVSDNHIGMPQSWVKDGRNNFVTQLWAAGLDEDDHLQAMNYGLATVTLLGKFAGQIWLSLDGAAMGRATVRPGVRTRQLGIGITDLPSGGSVEVLQGRISYASTVVEPNCAVVATLGASQLVGGTAELVLPVTGSCFFYLRVRDAAGAIVGFTNPVMHLASTPPSRGPVSDRRILV